METPATGTAALARVWEAAATSDANFPGKVVAYHDICKGDFPDFPDFEARGERPWATRWQELEGAVRGLSLPEGARFLELGCNMALLSIHLVKHGVAGSATCVDWCSKITAATEEVAGVFGVADRLRVLATNLDTAKGWEEDLGGPHQLVSCLNLYNWVKQKRRLLLFLGKQDVVLYEGHDALSVELTRLWSVGFRYYSIVAYSERQRCVFMVAKEPPAGAPPEAQWHAIVSIANRSDHPSPSAAAAAAAAAFVPQGRTATLAVTGAGGNVRKAFSPSHADHFGREVSALVQLQGSGFTPSLLAVEFHALAIVMTHCGAPLTKDNVPPDAGAQLAAMQAYLDGHGFAHNDVKAEHLLVKDGKLFLVDFGWFTQSIARLGNDGLPPTNDLAACVQHAL